MTSQSVLPRTANITPGLTPHFYSSTKHPSSNSPKYLSLGAWECLHLFMPHHWLAYRWLYTFVRPANFYLIKATARQRHRLPSDNRRVFQHRKPENSRRAVAHCSCMRLCRGNRDFVLKTFLPTFEFSCVWPFVASTLQKGGHVLVSENLGVSASVGGPVCYHGPHELLRNVAGGPQKLINYILKIHPHLQRKTRRENCVKERERLLLTHCLLVIEFHFWRDAVFFLG